MCTVTHTLFGDTAIPLKMYGILEMLVLAMASVERLVYYFMFRKCLEAYCTHRGIYRLYCTVY